MQLIIVIINKMFTNVIFPNNLKTANMHPLIKARDNLLTNYLITDQSPFQ